VETLEVETVTSEAFSIRLKHTPRIREACTGNTSADLGTQPMQVVAMKQGWLFPPCASVTRTPHIGSRGLRNVWNLSATLQRWRAPRSKVAELQTMSRK
jgi:uncharacterized protein YjiS (DUF1127 family)